MHTLYKGIRIALVSQYDAMSLPQSVDPGSDKDLAGAPDAVDISISACPSSQFWIHYSCDAPARDSDTQFYYFKLHVAGKFQVAWGCGAQDDWKGKTMFVPAESGSSNDGKARREKLGLFFPHVEEAPSDDTQTMFEIRVYRAKARKRQQRQYALKLVDEGAGSQLR